jgi:hypothetical protein
MCVGASLSAKTTTTKKKDEDVTVRRLKPFNQQCVLRLPHRGVTMLPFYYYYYFKSLMCTSKVGEGTHF